MTVTTKFLIGLLYYEPIAADLWLKGTLEDCESSTNFFVLAQSAEDALTWAEQISRVFREFTDPEHKLDNERFPYICYLADETTIEHCRGYVQTVQVGELPVIEDLSTDAYTRWYRTHVDSDAF
jgi:hypothetical protein